eukprot:5711140-Ditylum_brightwellii.AAC.1
MGINATTPISDTPLACDGTVRTVYIRVELLQVINLRCAGPEVLSYEKWAVQISQTNVANL